MNGHQQPNRLKYAVILALGLGVTQIVNAVGLGPIVGVNSHLGQPLSASIRVDNISKEQAQSASVSLASAEEYRSRGIQRLPSHDQLRFKLTPAGNGYRIQVTSNKGIREPFINFLLTINVGGQKITREYALFLNPDGNSPAPAPEPVKNAPPVVASRQEPAKAPQAVNPEPARTGSNLALGHGSNNSLIGQARPSSGITPASPASEGWGGQTGQPVPLNSQPQLPAGNAGGSKYTVKSGDTLYRIALAAAPSGTDVNAMMRAIQRANPHAFGSSSPNSLKAGATLTIPGGTLTASADTGTPAAQAPQPRGNKRGNRRNQQPPAVTPEAPAAETPPASAAPGENIAASLPPEPVQGGQPPAEATPMGDEGTPPVLIAEVGNTPDAANQTGAENPPPASQETPPVGMDTTLTLEGMDGVADPSALVSGGETPPATADTAAADTAAVSPDVTVTPPPADVAVAETPPATAENPPVANPDPQPPAATQGSSLLGGLELPFGLQLWHLLLAGGLLLAGLLLALLLKARRRRRSTYSGEEEFTNMSPAEIDRMVAEMENDSSLQRSFSNNLHDLDELSYEALSQEKEKETLRQSRPEAPPPVRHDKKSELIKAKMAELEALQAMEDDEDDDFEQLSQKAGQIPVFDLHPGNAPAQRAPESKPAAKQEAVSNLFDDWNFKEQEPTVQTSAHESNVDDFFNVDEKLEEVIKPAPAPAQAGFTHAAPGSAPTAVQAEVSPEQVEAMEINLDLATSFIATGNAARARVWLEEVLLEGNAAQKALAAQLLKKVDAAK